MPYRIPEPAPPILCDVTTAAELHVLNGTIAEFAIPCYYVLPLEAGDVQAEDAPEGMKLVSIHLAAEGYTDPILAVDAIPTGLTWTAWIDELDDSIIRFALSAQCPDAVDEQIECTIAVLVTRATPVHGERTDAALRGKLVILASPIAGLAPTLPDQPVTSAARISTDVMDFNDILGPGDIRAQLAFDTINMHVHVGEHSLKYYGVIGDGITNCTQGLEDCLYNEGLIRLTPGDYRADELPPITASNQGIVGDGIGRSRFFLSSEGVRRAPDAPMLLNCRFEKFSIHADPNALTDDGQQQYVMGTAMDLTGMTRAVVRDIYAYRMYGNLILDWLDNGHYTYYNHVEDFRSWGGIRGLFIGGMSHLTTPDGANANKFFGCEFLAVETAIQVRGANNSFVGTKIECPLNTHGYPASATGIQIDSGFYAVANTFTDTYMELGAAGGTNKGIYVKYNNGIAGWCTPNRFIGGEFAANGLRITPEFDPECASQIYGFHFDATGLLPTRRLAYTPDGTLIQETYPNGGGILQTDALGNTVYSAS